MHSTSDDAPSKLQSSSARFSYPCMCASESTLLVPHGTWAMAEPMSKTESGSYCCFPLATITSARCENMARISAFTVEKI